ncbi:MAG TPA: choice-of-anchor V domain-containing protein [Planctomycetota bacterium]
MASPLLRRNSFRRALATGALAAALTLIALADVSAGAGTLVVPCDGIAADPPTYDNCTLCHVGGGLMAGDGDLELFGVPAEYVPGANYPLIVRLQDPGMIRWGFQITAIFEDGSDAGTFTATDPVNVQVSHLFWRTFVKHTVAGSRLGVPDGPVDWNFDWTAPVAGSGTARFYLAALASNGDDTPDGDDTYLLADAAAESGAAHPDLTLLVQPDGVAPRRGGNFDVWTTVRNHATSARSALLVSRVRLASGALFPGNSWLQGPLPFTVPAGGRQLLALPHALPPGIPYLQGDYLTAIGSAPATLLDLERFAFSVQ